MIPLVLSSLSFLSEFASSMTHARVFARIILTRKQSRAVLLFSATLPLIIRHPAHTYFFLQSRYITHPVLSKRALDYSGNRGAGTRYIQKHIYSRERRVTVQSPPVLYAVITASSWQNVPRVYILKSKKCKRKNEPACRIPRAINIIKSIAARRALCSRRDDSYTLRGGGESSPYVYGN